MKKSLSLLKVYMSCILMAISVYACGRGDGGHGSTVNTGSDSETQAGSFALDFSLCPGNRCIAVANGRRVYPVPAVPSIADRELTVEAWIKSRGTSGGVFSRMDPSAGITLYINNGEPKFAMRVRTGVTITPGVTGTSEYIVGSGFSLVKDVWTHIAGVIAHEDHSLVHPAVTCVTGDNSPGGETEAPHLDIYVNGEIQNCGTTWGAPADTATNPQFADDPFRQELYLGYVQSGPIDGVESTIDAVIDEVRFWMTGRTASEIETCMNKELGLGRECSISNPDLIGYWRFNEGEGSMVSDYSGNGFSASLLSFGPAETAWDTGWVAGYPFHAL